MAAELKACGYAEVGQLVVMIVARRRPAIAGWVLMLSLLVGGCGSAGPVSTPSHPAASATAAVTLTVPPLATASPAPSESVAVSQRYGYSLRYPAAWAFTQPPGSGGVHPDEPGVDTYRELAGRVLSVVGQSNVPALAGWTCSIDRHLQVDHELAVESTEDLTVAGGPARLTSYHLVISPYVIHYLTVELVRSGRGLALSLESTSGQDADDRAVMDHLLAGLEFHG
jgi:hypothetical protein